MTLIAILLAVLIIDWSFAHIADRGQFQAFKEAEARDHPTGDGRKVW